MDAVIDVNNESDESDNVNVAIVCTSKVSFANRPPVTAMIARILVCSHPRRSPMSLFDTLSTNSGCCAGCRTAQRDIHHMHLVLQFASHLMRQVPPQKLTKLIVTVT